MQCKNCSNHLGWMFSSNILQPRCFYGLAKIGFKVLIKKKASSEYEFPEAYDSSYTSYASDFIPLQEDVQSSKMETDGSCVVQEDRLWNNKQVYKRYRERKSVKSFINRSYKFFALKIVFQESIFTCMGYYCCNVSGSLNDSCSSNIYLTIERFQHIFHFNSNQPVSILFLLKFNKNKLLQIPMF